MLSKDSIIVKTKVAPMYRKPTFKSEMVTQSLVWEKLKILDTQDNWFKVKQWDNYVSWVHNSYITDTILAEKIIKENNEGENFSGWYCNNIFKCGNEDIQFLGDLSLGSCVPIFQDKYGFSFKNPDGSVEDTNIENFFKKGEPICNYPSGLLHFTSAECGIPYLWGGKSSFGYDCSGFVQTILKLYCINFPRDCSEQIESSLLTKIDPKDSNQGDLIFFQDKDNGNVSHVGILVDWCDSISILHSSGSVKIEWGILRKDKKGLYINKLMSTFYGIYRLKNEFK